MKLKTCALILIVSTAALIASTNSIVKADENVIILSQTAFTEYYSGGGAYHVFGEVQNIGNQAVRYNITATFYNSKNEVVVTSFLSGSRWFDNIHGDGDSRAFSYLLVLQPSEKSPFELVLPNGWVDINSVDHYTLEVTSSPANQFSLGLKIASNTLYNSSGNLNIDGELKNVGNKGMDEIKVIATFYNKSGEIVAAGSVGQGFSPVDKGEPGFSPNQTYQFSLRLATGVFASVYSVIDRYALTAEGYTYADNTAHSLGTKSTPHPTSTPTTSTPIELYATIAIAIIIVLIASLLVRTNIKRKKRSIIKTKTTNLT